MLEISGFAWFDVIFAMADEGHSNFRLTCKLKSSVCVSLVLLLKLNISEPIDQNFDFKN